MGLFGPPQPKSSRQPAKTGGAGNMGWYNQEVAAAASTRRPASASQRGYASQRPASATLQQTQQQYYAPQQTQPLSYPRPVSARTFDLPVAEEHEEACICTVCACGRHACPPTPRTTSYDPNMTSEARSSYSGRFAPAKRASAPGQWKPHDVPFEGTSTHRADFPNHGNVPRRSAPSKSSMMDTGVGRSGAPFDPTTTHKSDFPAHPLGVRKSAAPNNELDMGPDDRDWSTEGRNAYRPHPVQARRSRAPEELKPSLPFQGTSTNKQDFPYHAGARPSVPKFRTGGFAAAPEDRNFSTEVRSQYLPKQLDPCPAIPVAVPSKSRPGHVQVEYDEATATYRRKPLGSY